MKIIHTRRISQIFFFILFLWFCIVSTAGDKFHHLGNWPVNWFFQLDPLAAVGTLLSTQKLYWPLLWALVTVILTIILGRFFCGWVCPFGSLHQLTAYLSNRKVPVAENIRLNRYRKAQNIKYFILIVFLAMAAFPSLAATLQTGLLDPISLITRSFNLVLVPIFDRTADIITASPRFYEGAWLIFVIFFAAVILNIVIPRFYCRFICPLGALFGFLSRFAVWRIGKDKEKCSSCKACERSCQGGCEPSEKIKISECVLCLNCRQDCKDQVIGYRTRPSASGEVAQPDISRRGFVLSLTGGVLAVPAIKLSGQSEKIIRPPGALPEEQFLNRCLKCGQCMRVCPTNVIQPAGFESGLQGLWTPVMNYRIGTSGCQMNCTDCSRICPTAAIRPITLSEKLGKDEFSDAGPIKPGTAFLDRNRCLAWAMDKPCIVCQENCPVSPKAIYTQEVFSTVRDGVYTIRKGGGDSIETAEPTPKPGKFATGDYYCLLDKDLRALITDNFENTIKIAPSQMSMKNLTEGSKIAVQIKLQRPYVDTDRCIGCGICEHECPLQGSAAIRVQPDRQG